MNPALRRATGITAVLLAFALAFWLALGPSRDWEGGTRWIRHGLALGSLGLLSFGVRLSVPARSRATTDTTPQ
ncbi:hypothetical protein [Streptomyces sp. NPDC029526]|uniref:hypothetical protein n=1 Tax=Streptomyces sp. NPDC029526 TaxID=3155728 RepID=UPI0033DE582B